MSEPRLTYRITLIHGTFARGAPWTQENSRLSTALVKELGGNVEISRCEWSGWNSAGAREAGASKLAQHLQSLGPKDPDVRRFVLAHSHGGNVALYALRNAEVAALVDGVVCLATPFIVARPRDLGPKGTENIVVVLLLATFASYRLLIEPRLPAWLGDLGSAAGAGVFMFIAMFGLLFLYARWARMANGVLETLRLADLPSHKLIILRTTGDEASALLLFFQFMSLLAVRLFHAMQGTYALLERHFAAWSKRKAMLLAVAAAGFALQLALLPLLLKTEWFADHTVAVVVAFAMSLTVVLPLFLLFGWVGAATVIFRFIALLALVPAAFALALCMLPFDWRVALANLLVDVTAETAPPGTWTMHQFVPEKPQPGSQTTPGLAHSAIYDDERAIRTIVDWIRNAGSQVPARATDSALSLAAR